MKQTPRKSYRVQVKSGTTAIMDTPTNRPSNRHWRGTPKEKPRARSVDFFQEAEDFECAMLGSLGFATNYIMEQTGLSFGQVIYRLGKAGIRRMDFRHGKTAMARFLIDSTSRNKIAKEVRRELHETIS